MYAALRALPASTASPAIVQAKEVTQLQITAVKATLRDSKLVQVRLASTEAFLIKQRAQLVTVEEELHRLLAEKIKLKEIIVEKEAYVELLKAEQLQVFEDEQLQPASNGREELTELLAVVEALPIQHKRAKALAEAVKKIWNESTKVEFVVADEEEDSSDEMDREMYGSMCGAIIAAKEDRVAVRDPYCGGDSSWDAPPPAAEAAAVLQASSKTSIVKSKIDKINKNDKSDKPFHRGGPLNSFGAPKYFRKPTGPSIELPGFVAPGVEMEDY